MRFSGKLRSLFVFFMFASLTLCFSTADAMMIGVRGDSSDSDVVWMDETGGFPYGGTIGNADFAELESLAVDNYGNYYSVGGNALITIDPTTGAGTQVATLDFGTVTPNVRGLAFSSTGELYAINSAPGEHEWDIRGADSLYSIDMSTGLGSYLGDTSFDIVEGLTFSPRGELYAWDHEFGLLTVDVSTGAATDVNDTDNQLPENDRYWAISTLTFGLDGTLYGGGTGISTIDLTDGSIVDAIGGY